MNTSTVRKMLMRQKGKLSWREFAESMGEDVGYLHRMVNGLRDPSEAILNKLGLERVTIYRKKKSNGTVATNGNT